MVTFIKKRDGRVVDFNAQKIANAIMKAMNKCDLNGIKYAEEAAYIANSNRKVVVVIVISHFV
jgi:anaerobic ribonucleoside-triphosphate reductase